MSFYIPIDIQNLVVVDGFAYGNKILQDCIIIKIEYKRRRRRLKLGEVDTGVTAQMGRYIGYCAVLQSMQCEQRRTQCHTSVR